ncbi:MAG: hypothetical protein KKG76_13865 [Euryarchaeota archaeon]|nr:hypothetical protein [Euryarchaeota archaeon]
MQIRIFASFAVPCPAKTANLSNNANLRPHAQRIPGGAGQPELILLGAAGNPCLPNARRGSTK